MNKPITIKRDEFKSSIITIINHTELPAILMIDILEDVLRAVKDLNIKQEQEERTEWTKNLKKSNESDEVKTDEWYLHRWWIFSNR